MTTELEAALIARIASEGPITFASYMEEALYHPRFGYYSSGRIRTGRRGDFLTAPELDPSFGALWARGLHEIWTSLGRPDALDVVEIGPGEGAFAAGLLASLDGGFAAAVRYHLVERVDEVAVRQARVLDGWTALSRHRDVSALPLFENCVVIANEVLDNLPVHVVERTERGLEEVHVGVEDGRLVELLLPVTAPHVGAAVGDLGVELRVGDRYEVPSGLDAFVGEVARCIGRGALIFIDYGADAVTLAGRGAGTVACYSSAGVDAMPLEHPGLKDITVHVNWTLVERALVRHGLVALPSRGLGDVLEALGLGELDQRIESSRREAVERGDGAAAVRALSLRHKLAVLRDGRALGGQEVLCALRGAAAPRFIAG